MRLPSCHGYSLLSLSLWEPWATPLPCLGSRAKAFTERPGRGEVTRACHHSRQSQPCTPFIPCHTITAALPSPLPFVSTSRQLRIQESLTPTPGGSGVKKGLSGLNSRCQQGWFPPEAPGKDPSPTFSSLYRSCIPRLLVPSFNLQTSDGP